MKHAPIGIMEEAGVRRVAPEISDEQLSQLAALLERLPKEAADHGRAGGSGYLRTHGAAWFEQPDTKKLGACCMLLADLFEQGWELQLQRDLYLLPPGIRRREGESQKDARRGFRRASS